MTAQVRCTCTEDWGKPEPSCSDYDRCAVVKCQVCGEPMPPGEQMFKYHGYSGPCPKGPLPREKSEIEKLRDERDSLYDYVNGLLGLLQLVRSREDMPPEIAEVLRTNHRATDAAAYLTQIISPKSE